MKPVKFPIELTRDAMQAQLVKIIMGRNPLAVNVFGDLSDDKLLKVIELILAGVEKDYGGWPARFVGKMMTICAKK